ncbi:MAG: hypothetical protein JW810_08005, partial [Sedimentisphaerales bacterium]|nr:hypothetical protein [Sedimentisphaerales bacterium]
MIRNLVRIYLVWAALLTLASSGSLSGLEPSEIALLINQTNPDSLRIAESYCLKRGVPGDHIIAVTVADTDNLWRPYYHDRVAEPVSRWLRQDQRYRTIRCLVCCYGVPLRVGSVSLRP